ncbi:MAG: hypothetical protein ACRDXX_18855 [Stackebrandtia sp.]
MESDDSVDAKKFRTLLRKRTVLVVAGVVAAIVSVAVIVSFSMSSGKTDSSTGDESGAPATAAPPQDGSVTVTEHGMSLVKEDTFAYASVGAILRNDSDLIAQHTRVRFTLLDKDGEELADDEGTVLILLPGQELGIGWEFVAGDVYDGSVHNVDATDVAVEVLSTATWWQDDGSLEDDLRTDFSVEVGEVVKGSVDITLRMSKTPDVDLFGDRYLISVVFRNDAGEIVGSCDDSTAIMDTIELTCELVPSDIDREATEVYVDLAVELDRL